MKPLTMFILKDCPYCRQALLWMQELRQEDARLAEAEVQIVDEAAQPEIVDAYAYYYLSRAGKAVRGRADQGCGPCGAGSGNRGLIA